jgi:DNA invertase Pin-like site-specific DNA recombinase
MEPKMDAIIYAAKSTKDPKGSIPTQLADCRKLAEDEGHPVAAEYQDEAKSAYHGSRGDGLARARAHAERIAADKGACVLIVQHSDRLARGDGKQAKHLLHYALWAVEHGITIRSKQDPGTFELDNEYGLVMAALGGTRNNVDSTRKSSSIKDGYRRTVERGEWRGGILPGGYEVVREVDERGKVKRWITKHAEDEPHYDLIWRLAEQGASMQRISLELGRAGALTRPVRARIERGGREVEYQPRPFTTNRVQQVLNNPFYAGMQTYRGERYEGDWPTYVDIETFERLKAERDKRSGGGTKRGRGRPPEGYLLSGIARCAACGGTMQGVKDASRVRHYVCRNRREYDPAHEHHCDAPILDAAAVDEVVVVGIEHLLGDAATLLAQLESGQRAEREHLKREAASAAEAAKAGEHAAERATAEFAGATDDEDRALLKDAAKLKRDEAARARTRADAALDALNDGQADADPAAAATALRERLSRKVEEAGKDVKVLNAALRESFDTFSLALTERGVQVVPTLTDQEAWLLLEPAGAFSLG